MATPPDPRRSQRLQQLGEKRKASSPMAATPKKTKAVTKPAEETSDDPVAHWADTGWWPKDFSTSTSERPSSHSSATEERHSLMSRYSTYETKLEQKGIIYDDNYKDDNYKLISQASKGLINEMFEAHYGDDPQLLPRYDDDPQLLPCPREFFEPLWGRLSRSCNWPRLFRYLTPFVVPSAELLFVVGGQQHLEHVAEEISTRWQRNMLIGGRIPRPTMAIGLKKSAFTTAEVHKLKSLSSSEMQTRFTRRMYFPFLICEVVGYGQPSSQAERRCMKSSSMAVDAIIQLHRRVLGDDEASRLSGEVLVFSVVHEYGGITMCGHFAIIEGAKTTFHRCSASRLLGLMGFHDDFNTGKECYDFIRKLYDDFLPAHLKRITDVLAKMNDPREASSVISPWRSELDPSERSRSPSRSDQDQLEWLGSPSRRDQDPSQGSILPWRSELDPSEVSRSPSRSDQDQLEWLRSTSRRDQDPSEGSRSPTRSELDRIEWLR
ncbi:hypothetical protein AYO20_09104 [Fonsecaea nubica]|uniref:DUF7924 domain-containing protein n=1 Tax=Fonsecaea nubica TaxID=856822 RepID=A0A178CIC2_9EURO|nr:hypothetical protein AYO20_09104 [Fonsecaea nubica]OAL29720.1 hypothetical protein AYO20_09104 [Fonsecaea nubica]